jgi:hypothetical protein
MHMGVCSTHTSQTHHDTQRHQQAWVIGVEGRMQGNAKRNANRGGQAKARRQQVELAEGKLALHGCGTDTKTLEQLVNDDGNEKANEAARVCVERVGLQL